MTTITSSRLSSRCTVRMTPSTSSRVPSCAVVGDDLTDSHRDGRGPHDTDLVMGAKPADQRSILERRPFHDHQINRVYVRLAQRRQHLLWLGPTSDLHYRHVVITPDHRVSVDHVSPVRHRRHHNSRMPQHHDQPTHQPPHHHRSSSRARQQIRRQRRHRQTFKTPHQQRRHRNLSTRRNRQRLDHLTPPSPPTPQPKPPPSSPKPAPPTAQTASRSQTTTTPPAQTQTAADDPTAATPGP